MSRYRKIEVQLWADRKFLALSPLPPSGQSLWLFLLTGPHTGPIPGLFRIGQAAMAETLGWDLEAFREAFQEVFQQGMVKANWKDRVVWIPKAIYHNLPQSPNVIRSWAEELKTIPDCDLRTEALSGIREGLEQLGEAYLSVFDEITGLKPSGKPSPKPSGKPSGKPSRKTTPNQEQEQLTGTVKEKEEEKRLLLPDFVPVESWKMFVKHRAEMGKPMTLQSKKLALQRLERLHGEGHDPAKVIAIAVENGWKGFFGRPETLKGKPALSVIYGTGKPARDDFPLAGRPHL